jgi:MFS family permease
MRAVFTRAAIAGFAGFAVLGLFTSVSPAFLGTVLHHSNRALVGVVVLCAFAASVAGQVLSARLALDRALRGGCVTLIVGMAIVASSLDAHSLALLVVGAVIAGVGHGMSFRAGLGSVAGAAPDDERGEVTSTFFVVLYVGISIPVIGVGSMASAFDLVTAGVVFAALVALLAATALVLLTRADRARS